MVARWERSWYYRKRSMDWRNRNTGRIITGKPAIGLNAKKTLGFEATGAHKYGGDPHALKDTKKIRKILGGKRL